MEQPTTTTTCPCLLRYLTLRPRQSRGPTTSTITATTTATTAIVERGNRTMHIIRWHRMAGSQGEKQNERKQKKAQESQKQKVTSCRPARKHHCTTWKGSGSLVLSSLVILPHQSCWSPKGVMCGGTDWQGEGPKYQSHFWMSVSSLYLPVQ